MATTDFMCNLCKVKFSNENALKLHFEDSMHQMEVQKRCCILVLEFKETTTKENLIEVFSKHGTVVNISISTDKSYAVIEFKDPETVKTILKTEVKLGDCLLKIQPNITDEIKKIIELIPTSTTFENQFNFLANNFLISQNEIREIYHTLCNDLYHSLCNTFPGCVVYPFGSTYSGLSFKNSDIDIFVEVRLPSKYSKPNESAAVTCVNIARNKLIKSKLFAQVISIPKAKTPILKCVHVKTQINCDINFKNMLGVCNTRLIRMFMFIDYRIFPLLFLIKLWGKIQELTGRGKLTNYAINMMTIFYLQQLPVPVLHPILSLQNSSCFNFQEGWNGGFINDPRLISPSQNQLTVPQLLAGFFDFWSKFNFGFHAICPLIGKTVIKFQFSNPEGLPSQFFHYKTMISRVQSLKYDTPVCLQDPFELNHNITGQISSKLLERFQYLCKTASQLCLESEETNLLKQLLKKQKDDVLFVTNMYKCMFKIPLGIIIINKDDKYWTEESLKYRWFEQLKEFLIFALTKVCFLETNTLNNASKSKSMKLDGQADIYDSTSKNTFLCNCIGNINFWENRKSASKAVKSHEGLEREIAISNYIKDDILKGNKNNKLHIDFNLLVTLMENPVHAEIEIRNLKSNNSFFLLTSFIRRVFPTLFENHQKELKKKSASLTTEKTTLDNNTIPD